MADVSIGRLAAITGVKVPTIRFYEQNGLIAPPRRTQGRQRRYDADDVRRLHFIRHARDLGFSVEDIRQLLSLSERPAMPCDTATNIARHHLRQVEGKITRLRLIRFGVVALPPTAAFSKPSPMRHLQRAINRERYVGGRGGCGDGGVTSNPPLLRAPESGDTPRAQQLISRLTWTRTRPA